jgi:radical SAM superfamily enzyme YgiQ (UPF0313 family)
VYISKVFTFTPDIHTVIQADEIERGGTGYDIYKKLPKEIDSQQPDYSIYPVCNCYNGKTAYGFLTRGCIRNCAFCIVPKKEGGIRAYSDIETVLQGRKTAILMDNNVLASEHGLRQLEKIVDLKCKVDFNQGLDAKLVTDEIANILSKMKWIESIRFSCDTNKAIEPLVRAIEKLDKFGVRRHSIFVYNLVTDVFEAYERIKFQKELGITPFAQPYRDFENKVLPTQIQKDFASWVNNRKIFKSCDFKEFKPRIEFICNKYFKNK